MILQRRVDIYKKRNQSSTSTSRNRFQISNDTSKNQDKTFINLKNNLTQDSNNPQDKTHTLRKNHQMGRYFNQSKLAVDQIENNKIYQVFQEQQTNQALDKQNIDQNNSVILNNQQIVDQKYQKLNFQKDPLKQLYKQNNMNDNFYSSNVYQPKYQTQKPQIIIDSDEINLNDSTTSQIVTPYSSALSTITSKSINARSRRYKRSNNVSLDFNNMEESINFNSENKKPAKKQEDEQISQLKNEVYEYNQQKINKKKNDQISQESFYPNFNIKQKLGNRERATSQIQGEDQSNWSLVSISSPKIISKKSDKSTEDVNNEIISSMNVEKKKIKIVLKKNSQQKNKENEMHLDNTQNNQQNLQKQNKIIQKDTSHILNNPIYLSISQGLDTQQTIREKQDINKRQESLITNQDKESKNVKKQPIQLHQQEDETYQNKENIKQFSTTDLIQTIDRQVQNINQYINPEKKQECILQQTEKYYENTKQEKQTSQINPQIHNSNKQMKNNVNNYDKFNNQLNDPYKKSYNQNNLKIETNQSNLTVQKDENPQYAIISSNNLNSDLIDENQISKQNDDQIGGQYNYINQNVDKSKNIREFYNQPSSSKNNQYQQDQIFQKEVSKIKSYSQEKKEEGLNQLQNQINKNLTQKQEIYENYEYKNKSNNIQNKDRSDNDTQSVYSMNKDKNQTINKQIIQQDAQQQKIKQQTSSNISMKDSQNNLQEIGYHEFDNSFDNESSSQILKTVDKQNLDIINNTQKQNDILKQNNNKNDITQQNKEDFQNKQLVKTQQDKQIGISSKFQIKEDNLDRLNENYIDQHTQNNKSSPYKQKIIDENNKMLSPNSKIENYFIQQQQEHDRQKQQLKINNNSQEQSQGLMIIIQNQNQKKQQIQKQQPILRQRDVFSDEFWNPVLNPKNFKVTNQPQNLNEDKQMKQIMKPVKIENDDENEQSDQCHNKTDIQLNKQGSSNKQQQKSQYQIELSQDIQQDIQLQPQKEESKTSSIFDEVKYFFSMRRNENNIEQYNYDKMQNQFNYDKMQNQNTTKVQTNDQNNSNNLSNNIQRQDNIELSSNQNNISLNQNNYDDWDEDL